MTLKLLKQLVKRGGVKGIILNLLVMLAIRYLKNKFLEGDKPNPDHIINKLGESSDWREIFDHMSDSQKGSFIDEILRRLS